MNTIASEFSTTELGTIQIAPEVIEIIAGLATIEIEGVAGMSGGLAGGIAELVGLKNLSKGVKVQIGTNEAIIDVSIIVEYGYRIPEVCYHIQRSVKQAVFTMTGIVVPDVNIHIQDVHFKGNEKLVDNEEVVTHRSK